MLLEKNCSKIIKTFPKNPLNSKNYSVTNVTAFCEIFTPDLEKFSAVGLEFFNITFEFIEKNLNTRVLRHGNNNS